MKPKPNEPESKKSEPKKARVKKRPPLRNRNGKKREKVIQLRLTEAEFRAIRAAWGRRAAAVARMCLLGHEPPPRALLEGEDARKMIHALYALFAAAEKTRYWIRRNGADEAKAALAKEDEAFNHLARVCYSNI
jgi:hypothetical protein